MDINNLEKSIKEAYNEEVISREIYNEEFVYDREREIVY